MTDLQIRLGKLLKTERERQNRSLTELSNDLKIPEAHLQAIESGDIGSLPSALYFKLFARSYAEALGVDYVKAMDVMRDEGEADIGEEEREAEAPVSSRQMVRPRASEAKSYRGLWLLIGVSVIILAVVAWLVFLKGDGAAEQAGSADAANVTESETGSDSDQVAGPIVNREESAIDLDLMARDRTWAVVIADGDTAIQTNLKPWREYFIGAQESLVVSIGSPLAVDIMLNGVMANLSNPEDGSISSVVITPENATMFVQRGIADSADTMGGTGDTTGTGSSSATQGPADTTSAGRGTPDGT